MGRVPKAECKRPEAGLFENGWEEQREVRKEGASGSPSQAETMPIVLPLLCSERSFWSGSQPGWRGRGSLKKEAIKVPPDPHRPKWS